jgi:tetratricopeptide (TPR) repeat protein
LKAPSDTSVSREQIDTWLRQAEGHLAAYRLTSPKGNNAQELYQKVLNIDPDNPDAQNGVHKIADQYLELAMEAFDEGKFAKARTYVKRGLEIVKDHEELLELQKELATEQKDSDGRFSRPAPSYPTPGGIIQTNLNGVWQSQDGTIVVIDGNNYRISLGNNVMDMGSYVLQGNQIVVYSMMGLNRIVSYSLKGNTLTCVDQSSGYPLTTVYYRMK